VFCFYVSSSNKQGDGLVKLLEERTSGDFRVLSRGDMERARVAATEFRCGEEWQDKIMLLDNRQAVSVKSHKVRDFEENKM
jgi:hypothetical protein